MDHLKSNKLAGYAVVPRTIDGAGAAMTANRLYGLIMLL